MSASGAPAGILLVLAGVWLVLQTLVGGLVGKVMALGGKAATTAKTTSTSGSGQGKASLV